MEEDIKETDEENDEEIEVSLKELILDDKEIDLAVLEAYKEMPEEFKSKLNFGEYYSYYRRYSDKLFTDSSEEEIITEQVIPEEIKMATDESLAREIIDFIKKEFPDNEKVWIRNISQLFWSQKNLSKFATSPEIQLKMEKAEMLAQKQIDSEKEAMKKVRFEEEKIMLPQLVLDCVRWAKEQGLKKITLSDLGAFLLEKGIEVLPGTEKAIYSRANVSIKTR